METALTHWCAPNWRQSMTAKLRAAALMQPSQPKASAGKCFFPPSSLPSAVCRPTVEYKDTLSALFWSTRDEHCRGGRLIWTMLRLSSHRIKMRQENLHRQLKVMMGDGARRRQVKIVTEKRLLLKFQRTLTTVERSEAMPASNW